MGEACRPAAGMWGYASQEQSRTGQVEWGRAEAGLARWSGEAGRTARWSGEAEQDWPGRVGEQRPQSRFAAGGGGGLLFSLGGEGRPGTGPLGAPGGPPHREGF